MKKEAYCDKCNLKFEYNVNNLDDLKSTTCPKCNSIVTIDKKKNVAEVKTNTRLSNTGRKIFNFWYYFHFIFAIIGIICFFANLNILLIISTIINLLVYFMENLVGINRNYLGILGIVIASIISSIIIKNIIIGICIGSCFVFFVSSIIQLIIDFIFSWLFRKFN